MKLETVQNPLEDLTRILPKLEEKLGILSSKIQGTLSPRTKLGELIGEIEQVLTPNPPLRLKISTNLQRRPDPSVLLNLLERASNFLSEDKIHFEDIENN